MGTRRERVVLILDDKYSAGMLKAAGATAMLNRELKDLDPQLDALSRAANQAAQRDLPNMTRAADKSSHSIDQFSGRLGLAARAIGAFGPAAIPVFAGAAAGAAALAGQLSALALGGAVVMSAVGGMAEAVGFLNTARLEPTAANIAKANEQLALLEPSARRSAKALSDFLFEWEEVKDASQQSFFAGFTGDLRAFDDLLPQVERIFADVADVAGDMLGKGMRSLASDEWAPFFDFLENRAAPALETTLATIGNFSKGIAELSMAMSPLSQDFGGGLLGMSEQFEAWAEGVSQTEGYREFIDYVRETGPQVVETLGSLADAALQIGEAAAPLAGPVLNALEGIADAVALIADSPLGPPIMTAVTAMSALSLATKTFGTVAATSWGQAARGQTGYIASLRGANGGMAQMSAARSGVRAAGVGAAAMGAGAMGMQYTALGAIAGSVIPGVGTAAGAATGLVLDMATALGRAEKAAQDWDDAMASGDVSQIEQALEGKRDAIRDLEEGHWGLKDAYDALVSGSPYRDQMYREEAEAEEALAAAAEASARAQGYASDETMRRVTSMQALHDAMLAELNAEIGWEQAMLDAQKTVRENGRVVDKNGKALKGHAQAAIDSKREIYGVVDAWNQQVRAGDATNGQMRITRRTIRQMGETMGWGEGKIREVIAALDAVPPKKKTKVEIATEEAMRKLGAFANFYNSIRSKTVTLTTQYRYDGKPSGGGAALDDLLLGPMQGNPADGGTIPLGGGSPRRAAFGATVPHDNLGYADRYPYLLAPGEEVISNRFGQADRHRPLLKAINAGEFKDSAPRSMGRSSAGGGTQVHRVVVEVRGEMDLARAKAQIRQIASSAASSSGRSAAATDDAVERMNWS